MRLYTLLFFPATLLAAYPEVDYFERTTVGSYWLTAGSATFGMNIGRIKVSSSSVRGFRVQTASGLPNADQFVEALADGGWSTRGGGARGGIALRVDAAAVTGYACEVVANNSGLRHLRILRYDGASETTINSQTDAAVGPLEGDRLRFTISGSTLTCGLYQGPEGTTPRLSAASGTDSTYGSAGYVGFWAFTANVAWDDWHGGNLGETEPRRTWTCNPCFVSPTGTARGTGSKADPLNLNWAMSKIGTLAGVSIWARGGTYPSDARRYFYNDGSNGAYFAFAFSGSSGAYQTIREYPGETAILDAGIDCSSATENNYAMALLGTYGIFRDIEIRNSGQNCKLTCGGYGAINGVVLLGTQVHFVGGNIRDIQQGVTAFTHSGASVRDTVLKHFSKRGGAGGLNWHGAYTHNDSANRLRLVNNFFLHQMANGSGNQAASVFCWQHYSQSGENIKNTDAVGNIMAKCGGFYMSGGGIAGVTSSISIEKNFMYRMEQIAIQQSNALIQGFQVNDNYFDGPLTLRYAGGAGSQFKRNTVSYRGGTSSPFHWQPASGIANISSLTRSGTAVTVTIASSQGWQTGDSVTVSGVTCPSTENPNGAHTIAIAGVKTFTYTSGTVTETCTLSSALAAGPARFDAFDEAWDFGFDNNTYIRSVSGTSNFEIFPLPASGGSAALRTFTQWKALPGSPDAASTEDSAHCPAFGATCPGTTATNYVKVSVSEDEPFRCHVAVYNWKGLSSGINLDLASCGFASGDRYEVTDAQNLGGGAIASGTYSGSAIDLGAHMGLTAIDAVLDANYTRDPATCVPTVAGTATPAFTHTTSEFGTFLIRRKQIFRTVAVSFRNTFPSATQARLMLGLSATSLDFPAATVACAYLSTCTAGIDTHLAGRMYYQWQYLTAGGTVAGVSDPTRITID